ncbi:unnamed protein product [Adineta ricciae]|uniref:Uncharacterized protein n=1 Tax=Adineta ricciae TaxID=249248 RepID=A0A815ESM2_ADIRI|nr:unnamed protein product [Adineta ricciae]CAF1592963.1 unnamed protein product [Adineta ricciae]
MNFFKKEIEKEVTSHSQSNSGGASNAGNQGIGGGILGEVEQAVEGGFNSNNTAGNTNELVSDIEKVAETALNSNSGGSGGLLGDVEKFAAGALNSNSGAGGNGVLGDIEKAAVYKLDDLYALRNIFKNTNQIKMSFVRNAEEAFVDNMADRVINDIVPGGSGLVGGTVQTGVDQFVNNDINRDLFGGGLGSGGAPTNGGGFF